MFSFSTATAPGHKPAPDFPQTLDPEKPGPSLSQPDSSSDPYRGAILVLLAAAFVGSVGAVIGGEWLGSLVLLDVAISLGISTVLLGGVALAQRERAKPPAPTVSDPPSISTAPAQIAPETGTETEGATEEPAPRARTDFNLDRRLKKAVLEIGQRIRDLSGNQALIRLRISAGAAGLATLGLLLLVDFPAIPPALEVAAVAAAICFIAAGLTATAVRYLADADPTSLPEAVGLCRGARVLAWILVLAGVSMGFAWVQMPSILRILHWAMFIFNAALCSSLIEKPPRAAGAGHAVPVFPLDLKLLSVLGNRANLVASVLDAGEQQLGIDLRSTWALTVVRQSVEPLIIGLCLAGWLSTSLTVVGVEEQGLIERLGVPVEQPLSPGLHLHWPWPIDQVIRIPVMRVQTLTVGHEGKEEAEGPENVLWAKEHAANEYTLLLGNGRDLITVDAAVQFRISDARAWRYHTQNPADALKAAAYKTVMRNTVNRTLSEALSENVVALTKQMRSEVQSDADALGLGVEVLGFTVGGMHPPVAVATDYQAVVSAGLGKVTAVVNAQAFRNQTVPRAEAYVVEAENSARAQGAQELGAAAGEAWAFRTVESQYRAAPQEYLFRRRLETLEKGLAQRTYTIVDSRFQRDGGELWIVP